jgi:hypothetical protein
MLGGGGGGGEGFLARPPPPPVTIIFTILTISSLGKRVSLGSMRGVDV